MSAPLWIDYAGARWALMRYSVKRWPEGLACEFCGKAIRKGNGCYLTKGWRADGMPTHFHQRCLIGQIDPSIFDIPIGRTR